MSILQSIHNTVGVQGTRVIDTKIMGYCTYPDLTIKVICHLAILDHEYTPHIVHFVVFLCNSRTSAPPTRLISSVIVRVYNSLQTSRCKILHYTTLSLVCRNTFHFWDCSIERKEQVYNNELHCANIVVYIQQFVWHIHGKYTGITRLKPNGNERELSKYIGVMNKNT